MNCLGLHLVHLPHFQLQRDGEGRIGRRRAAVKAQPSICREDGDVLEGLQTVVGDDGRAAYWRARRGGVAVIDLHRRPESGRQLAGVERGRARRAGIGRARRLQAPDERQRGA